MDYFIQQGYSGASLGLLNRCRLYLQIISLADIASVDGSCIIPEVFCGIPLTDRTSTLRWPHQQRPNQKAWDLWSAALRKLQPCNCLIHPLGPWSTHVQHQSWHWFRDSNHSVLYRWEPSDDSWRKYISFPNPRLSTRLSASTVFDINRGCPIARPPSSLFPASISVDRYTQLATAVVGPAFPAPPLPHPVATDVPSCLLQDAYFRSFYGNYLFPDEVVYRAIATGCRNGISVLYRGHCEEEYITYGWTMYLTETSNPIHTGVLSRGVVPGVSSESRTELEVILHVVHVLACIFSTYSVKGGRIHLFCLTKTKTKLVRGLLYQSVSTALDDHGDILSDLAIRLRYLHSRSTITYKYLN